MTHSRGFTLVEILVAISLSGIIITALLSVFFSFIEYQASTQEQRDALESVRFLLSDISRDISFGSSYVCDSINFPVKDSDGNTIADQCGCITFRDQLNRSVKVRYNSVAERAEKSVAVLDRNPHFCAAVGLRDDDNIWAPLTDDSIDIRSLRFAVETQSNRQPRVKIFVEAGYVVEGEEEILQMKTQVTKRIIEPSRDILQNFKVGFDVSSAIQNPYFIYATCPVPEPGETAVCEQGTYVCRDEQGDVYSETDLCDTKHRPVSAEFTEAGLYVLVDSGLVFLFLTQSLIQHLLQLVQ